MNEAEVPVRKTVTSSLHPLDLLCSAFGWKTLSVILLSFWLVTPSVVLAEYFVFRAPPAEDCIDLESCGVSARNYMQYQAPLCSPTDVSRTHAASFGPVAVGNRWLIRTYTQCSYDGGQTWPAGGWQLDFWLLDVPAACDQGANPPSCPTQLVLVPPEEPAPKQCNETNPCNPANGNKFQKEADYGSAGNSSLSFVRYYNSTGSYRTASNMAPGWRHSYSRVMNERPDKEPSQVFVASSTQSSTYSTAADACTLGWEDIKATVYSGDLATGVAVSAGDNTCNIEMGGSTVAYFRIKSNSGGAPVPVDPDYKTFTRPNGANHRFELDNGVWVNRLDSSLSLVQVGSTFIFTDRNDTEETYNALGQLLSIKYRNGQTETLTYDLAVAQGGDGDDSTLDRITGPFGHTITLTYDIDGRLGHDRDAGRHLLLHLRYQRQPRDGHPPGHEAARVSLRRHNLHRPSDRHHRREPGPLRDLVLRRRGPRYLVRTRRR